MFLLYQIFNTAIVYKNKLASNFSWRSIGQESVDKIRMVVSSTQFDLFMTTRILNLKVKFSIKCSKS